MAPTGTRAARAVVCSKDFRTCQSLECLECQEQSIQAALQVGHQVIRSDKPAMLKVLSQRLELWLREFPAIEGKAHRLETQAMQKDDRPNHSLCLEPGKSNYFRFVQRAHTGQSLNRPQGTDTDGLFLSLMKPPGAQGSRVRAAWETLVAPILSGAPATAPMISLYQQRHGGRNAMMCFVGMAVSETGQSVVLRVDASPAYNEASTTAVGFPESCLVERLRRMNTEGNSFEDGLDAVWNSLCDVPQAQGCWAEECSSSAAFGGEEEEDEDLEGSTEEAMTDGEGEEEDEEFEDDS